MPEALLLALPIVGGFLAVTRLDVNRFKMARATGQRFYFTIVNYALLLSGIAALGIQLLHVFSAWVAVAMVPGDFPPELMNEIRAEFLGELSAHRMHIVLLAFCGGHISPKICNSRRTRSKYLAVAIDGHDFEQMVATSQEQKKPMLITLDTGKIYLGWAVEGPNPEIDRRWVRILPWASGYRNQKQKVRFATDYTKVISRIQSKDPVLIEEYGELPDVRDFEVILPIENVVSAHLFDIAMYKEIDSDGAKMFEEIRAS